MEMSAKAFHALLTLLVGSAVGVVWVRAFWHRARLAPALVVAAPAAAGLLGLGHWVYYDFSLRQQGLLVVALQEVQLQVRAAPQPHQGLQHPRRGRAAVHVVAEENQDRPPPAGAGHIVAGDLGEQRAHGVVAAVDVADRVDQLPVRAGAPGSRVDGHERRARLAARVRSRVSTA